MTYNYVKYFSRNSEKNCFVLANVKIISLFCEIKNKKLFTKTE